MPSPGPNEVLVRVMAAGVAPWDAIIREGKSKVSPPTSAHPRFRLLRCRREGRPRRYGLRAARRSHGVTNPQFCGAQAEFAVAASGMIARKPQSLNHVEAASAPVIAVNRLANAVPVCAGDARTNRDSRRSRGERRSLRRTNGRRRWNPRRCHRPPRRRGPAPIIGA